MVFGGLIKVIITSSIIQSKVQKHYYKRYRKDKMVLKKINWFEVVKEIKDYKHKVGDVIYPFSDEGIMLRKKKVTGVKCWAVIEKVNKKGYWTKLRYMYNNETADLYGLILSGRKFIDKTQPREVRKR